MSEELIPSTPVLPNPPQTMEEVRQWAREVSLALQELYYALSYRADEMILQGVAADKPAATGRRRFYYETDTQKLFYDSGTWDQVGGIGIGDDVDQGTLASRPAASGSGKFYFATDTDELFYDDGAWVQINHSHTTGGPTLGSTVVLTYTT